MNRRKVSCNTWKLLYQQLVYIRHTAHNCVILIKNHYTSQNLNDSLHQRIGYEQAYQIVRTKPDYQHIFISTLCILIMSNQWRKSWNSFQNVLNLLSKGLPLNSASGDIRFFKENSRVGRFALLFASVLDYHRINWRMIEKHRKIECVLFTVSYKKSRRLSLLSLLLRRSEWLI